MDSPYIEILHVYWSCKCFIYYMAWDGIHLNVEWKNHKFESNVSKNNWNIAHMDVKPKHKQLCTYALAGTYNKAENFQWILWTRQSAEWGN